LAISKSKALAVAQQDAALHYRNLSAYRVSIIFDSGDWRVDYELSDPQSEGGGPHYLISGMDGQILERRYEQ
jgi:hypothetical protein